MTHQAQGLVDEIDYYPKRLFPICRSITGEGNRETLRILQEIIPLTIKEYPPGRKVYDWVREQTWKLRTNIDEKICYREDGNNIMLSVVQQV